MHDDVKLATPAAQALELMTEAQQLLDQAGDGAVAAMLDHAIAMLQLSLETASGK